MLHSLSRPAYSYRADPTVPGFDDGSPLTVMDGSCVLCSAGARLIARFDTAQEFRICPVQSDLGQALLRHYGIDPDDPESWLYFVDGQAFGGIEAMILAGERMGGWARAIGVLRLLPRPARAWLYVRIARNRYRLFGRTDLCAIPDPRLRARLIGGVD